ncbi:hypothetical protein [Halapricum salinum]|uniref:hypothetical protein n=1 Tax=Halapricum salinum TaxID=1457250 RepID=UPI001476A793|nr:hypothetical protein [Halapricum salinum]
MTVGTQSRPGTDVEGASDERPEIAVCESTPGRSVFLESDNTDGWIASDTTIEVRR